MVKKQLTQCQAKHDALKAEYATLTRMLHETEQALNRASTDKTLRMNELNGLRKQIEREYLEKVKLEDEIMEKMRSQLTLDKASHYTKKLTSKKRDLTKQLVYDWKTIKFTYSIILLDVLVKHFKYFKLFQQTLSELKQTLMPENINNSVSEVIPLPVLAKNEQKYSDVIDIMDSYEQLVEDTFLAYGHLVTSETKVHIGGDQLTRERFSGAKRLRSGALTDKEKFTHLSPIRFELFHLQMNVLQMFYKLLYNNNSTEPGTLYAEKIKLSRTHANGEDVKKHYDDCKELAVSLIDSHVVSAMLNYFAMSSVDSEPKDNFCDDMQDVCNMTNNEKKHFILRVLDTFLNQNILGDTIKFLVFQEVPQECYEMQVLLPGGVPATLFVPINNDDNLSDNFSEAPTDRLYHNKKNPSTNPKTKINDVRYKMQLKRQWLKRKFCIVSRWEEHFINNQVIGNANNLKTVFENRIPLSTLLSEANSCDKEIQELRQHQQDLSHQLEERQIHVQQLQGASDTLDGDIDRMSEVKQKNLADLVSRQRRVKYFQQAKDGKYTMLCRSETSLESEHTKQVDRMQALSAIVDRLNQEFPHIQPALRRVTLALSARTMPAEDETS
ncbi:hypothetical protein ScPMuIL_004861 [Solemya velum]